MAEIPNSGFAMETASDFVAIDIGNVAIAAAAAADKDSNSTSSPRVIKSFSRKGSLRVGVDNKKAAAAAAIEGEADTAFALNDGAHHAGKEKHAVTVHVARVEEPVAVTHVLTPTSAARRKYRRIGSSRRLASPWLDPRRVLFAFATLSSMGTLILLYFTLSLGKTAGGNAGAR